MVASAGEAVTEARSPAALSADVTAAALACDSGSTDDTATVYDSVTCTSGVMALKDEMPSKRSASSSSRVSAEARTRCISADADAMSGCTPWTATDSSDVDSSLRVVPRCETASLTSSVSSSASLSVETSTISARGDRRRPL